MFGSSEEEEGRGKENSGEESKEEWLTSTLLDVFKIKYLRRRRLISLFIVCHFVNMDRVNLVIYLVKHFYTLLFFQISSIWGN